MISRGLAHENSFIWLELAIEEGARNIDLVDFHVEHGSHGKNSSDRCELGDGSKSVKIVSPRDL